MSEFKVGDKVRVTAYELTSTAHNHVRNEGVVSANPADEQYVYVTTPRYTNWPYYEHELELIEETVSESGFGRFDDEYVDDEDVFNALVAFGIEVTREQYEAALEIAVTIQKFSN